MLDITPRIIYEDNHLLLVDKPAAMLSQGDRTGDLAITDAVEHYLRVRYAKAGNVYVGLLHRLDRPVSGLLLIAKTSKAAARMSRQFQDRLVQKIYLVWAEGTLKDHGRMEHFLIREGKLSRSVDADSPEAKEAVLEYHSIGTHGPGSLLAVNLLSGRHHQIRCQFSTEGHPVIGDSLYGSTRSFKQGKIALHSAVIAFEHPVRKEAMAFYSRPEFWPDPPRSLLPESQEQGLQQLMNLFQ